VDAAALQRPSSLDFDALAHHSCVWQSVTSPAHVDVGSSLHFRTDQTEFTSIFSGASSESVWMVVAGSGISEAMVRCLSSF
jgi:hypothetical protein